MRRRTHVPKLRPPAPGTVVMHTRLSRKEFSRRLEEVVSTLYRVCRDEEEKDFRRADEKRRNTLQRKHHQPHQGEPT